MRLTSLRNRNPGDIAFTIGLAVLCVVLVFLTLYPIYFVVIASVSDPTMVATGRVWLLPDGLSLFGYQQILEDTRIWTGYRNTLIYTVVGTAVNLLVTLPAAYALSRREFRPRKVLMSSSPSRCSSTAG